MLKTACREALILMALAGLRPALAQISVGTDPPVQLELHAKESRTVKVQGAPRSIQLIRIRLEGGLVWLQPPQGPARILDLGRGGELLYAVEVPGAGAAELTLRSGEQLRDSRLVLQLVTTGYTDAQRQHLYAAGVQFALADGARRRQPGAPDPATALRDYDEAAKEAGTSGDISLQRWVLDQKARFLLFQKSNMAATRDLLLRAASLPDAGDVAVQALTYKTLSSCEYFLGDLNAAVAAAERALQLYRQTGDVYWQGVVLGNLIADYSEMGRPQEAMAAGREALGDAEETQDTAGVVFCLTELANLYELEGDPQRAFRTFRQAETWSEDIRYAPLVRADIERALGQFYLDMGLWTEAQQQFEECLRMAAPDSPAALEARTLLAQTLRRKGTSTNALVEYNSAIETAQRLKLQPEETALRIERSQLLLQMGQSVQAQQDAAEASRLANTLNDPTLRIRTTLAESALIARGCVAKGSCQEAAQMYQQALQLMKQTNERQQESAAYAGLAEIHAAQGENEAALQAIEQALTRVEESRASFTSHTLAASYFEEWRGWYGLATRISLELDAAHPGQGYREIAFRFTERARARALLDAIGQTNHNQEAPSPDLRRRIAANQEQIEEQEAKLLGNGSAKLAAALQHLYREQDALEAESSGGRSADVDSPHIAGQIEVQQQLLGNDSVLVAFTPGADRSYRWVITRSSLTVRPLPSENELRRQLAPLKEMLTERMPEPHAGETASQYAGRVAQFKSERDRELKHAGSLLLSALPAGIQHIYLIADGDMLALPWGALRVACRARTCYAVERYAISLEPSASVAVALAGRSVPSGREGMLIVSDTLPLNEQPGLRWTSMGALPGSRREAEALAHLGSAEPVESLHGAEATVDGLRSGLRQDPAILHLATHTFMVDGHPELSGIVLSPGRSPAEEPILWLHDIPSLQAPPLVTLSGCATQGKMLGGEELNTLTQAFFYAGAQQVVASLWSVDDDATVDLMREFYGRLLLRRMNVDDALRSAELRLLARGADLSDWAAFMVSGAPAQMTAQGSARN